MKNKFIKSETYFHKCAVETLASWVNGITEMPFKVDGSIIFVPDITRIENGIIQCVYEVVHFNPLSGKKYGLIQYWCYRNVTELTVHEISAEYILSQKGKPDLIRTKESYIINPFEYEENEYLLIGTIK